MQQAATQVDLHRRIIDAENVLDHALKDLGYHGSMADKLRNAGPRFSALQSLWDAHKLRNRIAHEIQSSITASQADGAVHAFARALDDVC